MIKKSYIYTKSMANSIKACSIITGLISLIFQIYKQVITHLKAELNKDEKIIG